MFINIVSYSTADDVTFSCDRNGDELTVTFTDNGIPFDPVTAEICEKDFEELDSGGMGIKLARMNSKQMIYKRDGNRNVLTIIFEVPEKPKKNVRL
jgi:anti-sigma regulatory factor (Ser/Thr protein kinase)